MPFLNEFLFFASIPFYFSFMLAAYKLFGRTGIHIWIGFSMVLASIEVLKLVPLFGLPLTLGNVIYSSSFLATDILGERHGRKSAKDTVWIGFFTLLVFTAGMQLALFFVPHGEDKVNDALLGVFSFTPRIALASISTYLVSQHIDIWLFHAIRDRTGSRLLWLRNNGSSLVSQFVDTALFTLLAFTGIFPFAIVLELILTTYFVKFLISILDTPFIYLARNMKKPNILRIGEGDG